MPAILAVGDNIPLLDFLESLFRQAHYTVFSACDEKETLEVFCREAFDVVIIDVDMPGMGGIKLLKKIRKDNPSVPVVAISGEFDASVAVQAGFDAFIDKPFKIATVLEVVADMVKRTRKVLIVDDMPEARAIIRIAVGNLGFRSIEAGNGVEALDIMEREDVDLVISDCSMPVMDGRDFLTAAQRRFPNLRVIVASANFKPEDMGDLKPFSVLKKPYRLGDLKDVVLKAMS